MSLTRLTHGLRSSAVALNAGKASTTFLSTRLEERQLRGLHSTTPARFSPVHAGIGLAVGCYAAKLLLEARIKYKENKALRDAEEAKKGEASGTTAGTGESAKQSGFFAKMFKPGFYEGGFEDPMTRKEAALILGVRETSSKERIRAAHRSLALLNHPDTGGSTFLSMKINEAKDKLSG